jgi:hypothetical protein
MPPRNDELPEGTDHIINGAMETNGAGAAGAGGGGATGGGGSSSGFIGSGGGGTGGAAATGGGTMTADSDRSGAGGAALEPSGTKGGGEMGGSGVTEQLRSQVSSLRDQGVERVREFAEGGKTRTTDLLAELSRVVADTADSIDERLGNNYGEYARKAADGISGFADTLRGKDVDDLYEDVRDAIRKSPGVAIGVAAVLGFTVARLVKAGLPGGDERGGGASGGSGA